MKEVRIIKGDRPAFTMPWNGQEDAPWRDGYSRLFVPFSAQEMKNASSFKRGHIQIVRNDHFKTI